MRTVTASSREPTIMMVPMRSRATSSGGRLENDRLSNSLVISTSLQHASLADSSDTHPRTVSLSENHHNHRAKGCRKKTTARGRAMWLAVPPLVLVQFCTKSRIGVMSWRDSDPGQLTA